MKLHIKSISIVIIIVSLPIAAFCQLEIPSSNYQKLYDLTRKWKFPLIDASEADNTSLFNDVDYKQDGSLSAWSLAYCLQITPKLSAGATMNIWEDGIEKNKWRQKSVIRREGIVLAIFSPYLWMCIVPNGMILNLKTLRGTNFLQ